MYVLSCSHVQWVHPCIRSMCTNIIYTFIHALYYICIGMHCATCVICLTCILGTLYCLYACICIELTEPGVAASKADEADPWGDTLHAWSLEAAAPLHTGVQGIHPHLPVHYGKVWTSTEDLRLTPHLPPLPTSLTMYLSRYFTSPTTFLTHSFQLYNYDDQFFLIQCIRIVVTICSFLLPHPPPSFPHFLPPPSFLHLFPLPSSSYLRCMFLMNCSVHSSHPSFSTFGSGQKLRT